MKWVETIILTGLSLVLISSSGCKSKPVEKKESHRVLTVKKEQSSSHLYYNAAIAPISTTRVVSPVDGRIAHLYFSYGDEIKAGQKIVDIDSSKLAESFRSAISGYLTQKDSLGQQETAYYAAKALYHDCL